jgi:putative transcriptional regulator
MPIIVNLDVVLAQRKMRLNDLAAAVDITPQNLSILKTGKARAIRFSTLEAICRTLGCQPGDILEFRPEAGEDDPQAKSQPSSPSSPTLLE